ncbi:hypothetical protein [Arthrobacter woluwensis]|uniref:hypothetical protein n=1 Tax=Arthrobacter woluwensis TaxID=156980 RepID=UPI003810FDA6
MTDITAPVQGNMPTSDEIIGALRDAGWLLEQDTAATLSSNGFHTITAKAFPDPDDPNVSREIDVHGYRSIYRDDDLTFTIGARVLAECKQSSMPYVVVGRHANEYELERERNEQVFCYPRVTTARIDLGGGRWKMQTTAAQKYLRLIDLPGSPWEGGFVGTQLTRLDRKKTWLADNRGIFTSLVYPLAKAVTYYRQQGKQTAAHRPGQTWAHIEFMYPLVVTSAPVFSVDTAKDSPLEAAEVPWATITREIKSKNIDGQFHIDVVTATALGQYLDEHVRGFCDAVSRLAESDPHRFITEEDQNFDQ